MLELTPVIRGGKKVSAALARARANDRKALDTAVKVEGYRLRGVLVSEIRDGAPGGRRFAPLSHIAARLLGNRRTGPLSALAKAVRYWVPPKPAGELEMHIGWVGPQLSKSWKRLAVIHQEGFSRAVSDEARQLIVGRGARLGTVEGGDTPFFLKRSTKLFTTPARPIVDPFWAAHRAEARRRIADNFRRKIRGERI